MFPASQRHLMSNVPAIPKRKLQGAVLMHLGAVSLDRSNARPWMPWPPTFKSAGQRLALTVQRGGCAGSGAASMFTLRLMIQT
jgi:hypothetical protein